MGLLGAHTAELPRGAGRPLAWTGISAYMGDAEGFAIPHVGLYCFIRKKDTGKTL